VSGSRSTARPTRAGRAPASHRSTWWAAALDRDTHAKLAEHGDRLRIPASFGLGGAARTGPRPILTIAPTGLTHVACPTCNTRVLSRAHARALEAFVGAVRRHARWVELAPGSWLAFRSSRGLHMRDAASGAREIVRVHVRADLAPLRVACACHGHVFDVRHAI
jgi:hypothetical protein